jgi:hypothetical protein
MTRNEERGKLNQKTSIMISTKVLLASFEILIATNKKFGTSVETFVASVPIEKCEILYTENYVQALKVVTLSDNRWPDATKVINVRRLQRTAKPD